MCNGFDVCYIEHCIYCYKQIKIIKNLKVFKTFVSLFLGIMEAQWVALTAHSSSVSDLSVLHVFSTHVCVGFLCVL